MNSTTCSRRLRECRPSIRCSTNICRRSAAPRTSRAITSFVATGKSVGYRGFGGDGVVEVSAQAPDKRATYISFPEYPDRGVSVRTYDGRTGWIATPLAVVPKYELGGSERDGAQNGRAAVLSSADQTGAHESARRSAERRSTTRT